MAIDSNADSVARIFSLAALDASQTESRIVVAQDVGGIKAGTVYPEGTSAATILNDLLKGSAPAVDVTIYYGATDDIPSSTTGLTSKVVSSTELVGTYSQHITAGNTTTKQGQYVVFAIPTTYEVTKWCVPGFEYNIPHTLVVNEGYNIYYLNLPSYDVEDGGIDYLITIA